MSISQELKRKNRRLQLLLSFTDGWKEIRELAEDHNITLIDVIEILKFTDLYELSDNNKFIKLKS